MAFKRKIDDYVDELYEDLDETNRVSEKKKEIGTKLSQRTEELSQKGMGDQEAFQEAILDTKNLQGFSDRYENKHITEDAPHEQHEYSSMTNKLSVAGMAAGIVFILFGVVMSLNISAFGIYSTAAPAMFFYAMLGGMIFTYSMMARRIRLKQGMTHRRAALYACAVGAILFSIFITITVGLNTSNWYAGILSFLIFLSVGVALFVLLLLTNETKRNQ